MKLFSLGQTATTPGALMALSSAGKTPHEYLERHQSGDWGELPKADQIENEISVREGYRIMSVYPLPTGIKIWVITEADRSSTTILLPEEY